MSEEINADNSLRREGDLAFSDNDTANETDGDSQSKEENKYGNTQSDEGENTHKGKDIPFHDHPRWKQREDEWNSRFNTQEQRHQDDLKTIREEFGSKRKENDTQTKIPAWFGGTQEQWDTYNFDLNEKLTAAEERAEKRAYEKLHSEKNNEEKATKDATEFLHSEISTIESDRELNPTGMKVDAEKLLKVVLDNQLIDTKGRWNYRAGWKILSATSGTDSSKEKTDEKKKIAASTTSESRAESKPKSYTTSDDFKKDRPW